MGVNPITVALRFFRTQAELGTFLGVASGTISQWKYRAKIPEQYKQKLVDYTGLPKEEFEQWERRK